MLTSSSLIQWEPMPEPSIRKWTGRMSNFRFTWQLEKELVTPFLALLIQKPIGLLKNIVSKIKPAIGSDDKSVPTKKKKVSVNRESVPSAWTVLLILNDTVSTTACSQNARFVEILCAQPMTVTVILIHQARCI